MKTLEYFEPPQLLRDEEINTYCKVVVMPKTKVDMIGLIASKIAEEVQNTPKFSIVVQPLSPLKLWVDNSEKLFEISEEVGKYINVLIIPQVHKLLNVR